MLPPLGKLVPPDPPAKWQAIQSALESDEKTRRMHELMSANAWPFIICSALVLLATVVLAVATLLMR
jgi:hypothetical protein